jgi:thiamine-phosphate diphosphorylase
VNGLPNPMICLVTDRRRLAPDASTNEAVSALERFLGQAIEAAVDLIQVRERDLDAGVLCRLVRRIVDRARGSGVRVVVNDRADVALAAGADGVHLRGDSPAASRVRPMSPAWIIGRSVHARDRAEPDANADYLLFGAVFATSSKPGLPSSGVGPLRAIAASSSKPVLAVGGITPENARECRRAGAAGIAAIGAFLPEGTEPESLGVRAAVRAFREALADALPPEGSRLRA